MQFDWSDILPHVIASLTSFHQQLVTYIMRLPGKQRLSYAYVRRTWCLDREQFDAGLENAFAAIRQYLLQLGINSAADLELQ